MSFAGNYIPKLKAPKRAKPAFVRSISTAPQGSKPIELFFYTPPDYADRKKTGRKYPVVVDFHGGGFCLGHATDDRHWARVVMEEVGAVVVGVGYRLAPEHPFPGPVDDCIDAILWLSAHATEYSLDMSQTVLSGFSAGANLAITAPLRFEFFTKMHDQMLSVPSQASDLSRWPSTQALIENSHLEELNICSIVAWYPIVDWTASRSEKRRMSRMPKKTLPKVFTDLFDYSYLPPPDVHGYHCSPYTSPALAPDYMLNEGLPSNIQLWLCEWDMLLAEGEKFGHRLRSLGKNVSETMIPEVPHGFDQSANPLRDQAKIDDLYRQACQGIRDVLKQH
ncbi:catalytic protein [Rhizodiscina lignyota]|uniref:Catalytic protein n=1 Tax=Rhizodiscina lignyota TaxID=1504668 RepID=A0A9P4IIW8_9PEZI|nr:catalytic protein [Rhizodiscina lignyota]